MENEQANATSVASADMQLEVAIINNVGLVLSSAAWPIAFVVAVYLLRKQIAGFVDRVRKVRWGEFEASVDQEIQEKLAAGPENGMDAAPAAPAVSAEEISSRSPVEIIVTSWIGVERELDKFAEKHDPAWLKRKAGPIPPALLAELSFNDKHLIRELRNIRNRVIHDPDVHMSVDSLQLYVERASQAVALIRGYDDIFGRRRSE
ncbi:MAG TPA: hypothetical protein VEZ41_10415 [Allosphingosinicella sp.]|nr:hypothetical protein [Allosphingosinicella sp.]